MGVAGLPHFDVEDHYQGPLPSTCAHGGHPPLIKQTAAGGFATIHPPGMDFALATLIFNDFHRLPGGGANDLVTEVNGSITGDESSPVTGTGPVTGTPEATHVTGGLCLDRTEASAALTGSGGGDERSLQKTFQAFS